MNECAYELITKSERERIVKMYDKGKGVKTIARGTGHSRATVHKLLKVKGIKIRNRSEHFTLKEDGRLPRIPKQNAYAR